jgi:hypothetical protein
MPFHAYVTASASRMPFVHRFWWCPSGRIQNVPGKFGVCLDSSFPKNPGQGISVNRSHLAHGSMSLPTHKQFASDLHGLHTAFPEASLLANKFDITSAVYLLPFQPRFRPFTIFYCDGTYWMYRCTVMGLSSAPHAFQQVAVTIAFLAFHRLTLLATTMPRLDFSARSYIHDQVFFITGLAAFVVSKMLFEFLCNELGIPINPSKFAKEGMPQANVMVLGLLFRLNSSPFTVEIDDQRWAVVLRLLADWSTVKHLLHRPAFVPQGTS